MSKDNGGPAFPFPVLHGRDAPTGMTLRDYFAAQAMQAAITALVLRERSCDDHDVAENSYAMADAMLAERNKERTE